jgi:hypothetical protein
MDNRPTNQLVTGSQLLPLAEYAHNSWKHDATRQTPHELLFGMTPEVHVKFILENVPTSAERLQNLEDTWKEVQKVLEKQQQQRQAQRLTEMKVGDQVWLKGKNLSVRGHRKLLPKQYGPYRIKERVGNVAYQLKLPPSMKLHDIFHIDLLLPYKETEKYGPTYTRPPLDLIEGEQEYEVESIRDSRLEGRGRQLQYLVHWKGYPSSDDSWVDAADLHAPELLKEFQTQTAAAGRPNV